MAIQKTGVKYTAGGTTKRVEVSGQQNMVRLASLQGSTTYRVTPYVVDSGWGEVTGSDATFTTLEPSSIALTNQTTYDGREAFISFSFSSVYELADAVVMNDDTKDFANPDEYTPIVEQQVEDRKWVGFIKLQVASPKQWFVLKCSDVYGEAADEIFDINDLP